MDAGIVIWPVVILPECSAEQWKAICYSCCKNPLVPLAKSADVIIGCSIG